jgi:hypothetical protein
MAEHCAECRRMITAGELPVLDERGDPVCEDCQQETPAHPVTAELYRRLGLDVPGGENDSAIPVAAVRPGRGRCPVCGESVRFLADGRLRPHDAPPDPVTGADPHADCPGN